MEFRQCYILLLLLICLTGCSSNLANQTTDSPSPANTPDVCQQYAGEWNVQYFFNGEDESQIICGDKPCRESSLNNGVSFKLICQNGKIKGELISRYESHSDVNTAIFKTPTPQVREEIIPLKDARTEKDSLFLSYVDSRGCLDEISVSPKDKYLLGKFESKDCQKVTVTEKIFDKRGTTVVSDTEKGMVLLVKR